jgi:myosin heavy subunit
MSSLLLSYVRACRQVWTLLAAILHLGNITFTPSTEETEIKAWLAIYLSLSIVWLILQDQEPLEKAAQLLGVKVKELARVITTRSIIITSFDFFFFFFIPFDHYLGVLCQTMQ